MKIVDVVRKAVKECNPRLAGKVSDHCRFKAGMNYEETYQFFNKHTGIGRPEFEELMYEADVDS